MRSADTEDKVFSFPKAFIGLLAILMAISTLQVVSAEDYIYEFNCDDIGITVVFNTPSTGLKYDGCPSDNPMLKVELKIQCYDVDTYVRVSAPEINGPASVKVTIPCPSKPPMAGNERAYRVSSTEADCPTENGTQFGIVMTEGEPGQNGYSWFFQGTVELTCDGQEVPLATPVAQT